MACSLDSPRLRAAPNRVRRQARHLGAGRQHRAFRAAQAQQHHHPEHDAKCVHCGVPHYTRGVSRQAGPLTGEQRLAGRSRRRRVHGPLPAQYEQGESESGVCPPAKSGARERWRLYHCMKAEDGEALGSALPRSETRLGQPIHAPLPRQRYRGRLAYDRHPHATCSIAVPQLMYLSPTRRTDPTPFGLTHLAYTARSDDSIIITDLLQHPTLRPELCPYAHLPRGRE